jgi:hypothetical protein
MQRSHSPEIPMDSKALVGQDGNLRPIGNRPFATCYSAAPVGQPILAAAAFQAAFRPTARVVAHLTETP